MGRRKASDTPDVIRARIEQQREYEASVLSLVQLPITQHDVIMGIYQRYRLLDGHRCEILRVANDSPYYRVIVRDGQFTKASALTPQPVCYLEALSVAEAYVRKVWRRD